MSINVTVSGNPIYLDRGRVLLTDLETAKKNEWMRRRKIRLQQARQQAKDHTQNVRKKVSSEGSSIDKREREKRQDVQKKQKKEEMDKKRQEVEECLKSVGSGHHLASLQAECDALLREKQELRDDIARARGAIAEERMKAEKCFQKDKFSATVGRKQLVRKVEDLRSTLISNLPAGRSAMPCVKKTVRVQVHRGENEEDCLPSTAGSSRSPTRPLKNTRPSTSHHNQRRRSGYSDCEESDEGSDSDVTWPPRSARVVKEPIPSPRVRFYDHNTRVAKECPKPPYSVIPADPSSQPDMGAVIADEEDAVIRKENIDILTRRENLIRGSKALRKEREKKEAEMILKDIDEIEKRRKIQIAVSKSYPSKFHAREDPRYPGRDPSASENTLLQEDESDAGVVCKEAIPLEEVFPSTSRDPRNNVTLRERTSLGKQALPVSQADTEEVLEDLIHKLKEERARKQKQVESRFGVCGLRDSDIPTWIPQEVDDETHADDSKWENILDRSCEDEFRRNCEKRGRQSPSRYSGELSKSPERRPRISSENKRISEMAGSPGKKESGSSPKHEARSPSPNREAREGNQGVCDSRPVKQKLSFSKACSCSEKCVCARGSLNPDENRVAPSYQSRQTARSPENQLSHLENEEERDHFNDKICPSRKPSSSQITDSSVSESSSQAETLRSCLTYEGVKVVVKVSDKSKRVKTKSHVKICSDKDVQTSIQDPSKSISYNSNEITSSSTSYRSLPPKLSPENQSLLHYLLTRIDARNKNPWLHAYINQLLGMTRESIENLPVSSVSEVSVSSSVFEPVGQSIPISQPISEKYDVSCQVENSADDQYREEVMKFAEVAKGYANRVEDLAGMLESLNLLPHREVCEPEDTTYLGLPADIQLSVKFSDSVQSGQYPVPPPDLSDIPTSIHPHPSQFTQERIQPSSKQNGLIRKTPDDLKFHDLSTIRESDSFHPEIGRAGSPKIFGSNVSSIQGTPEKRGSRFAESDSSSLCLLDERDMGNSSLFGSSSDDFEEVFRSLGIAWALPTVRKVRESRQRTADTSSSSGGLRGQYSHSTPLKQSPARNTSAVSSQLRPSAGPSSHVRPPASIRPPAPCRPPAPTRPPTPTRPPAPTASHLRESDSLTPPSLTLNIPSPFLSRYS